jgi:predicted amidohydrolase
MLAQIRDASRLGADIVHFPEACLSGYAGQDLERYTDFDWDGLRENAKIIAQSALAENIWVVFGSAHPLTPGHKPHNSLYVVNAAGQLVDRYDKRFCAGDERQPSGDLAHYSPGEHFCSFELKGVKFGTLICHEYRYPELYREHARSGTQVLLHSFHAGNIAAERFAEMEMAVGDSLHDLNPATTIAGITQLTAAHAAASSNNLWISCANSSSPKSCWATFVVRPDGVCVGRLSNEVDDLLLTDIDTTLLYYDSTRLWRDRAISGQFHSGTLVDDPRSRDRQNF